MRHLLFLVGLVLLLGYSGSAAALVDARESDTPGSGVAAGQDIESVTIATAPVKESPPPAPPGTPATVDVTYTIKGCLAACPSGSNKSVKIRIGGATILLSVGSFNWTYMITANGGTPGYPSYLDMWDQEDYYEMGANGDPSAKLSRCCVTITTTASALGLGSAPPAGAVPNGNVGYDVTTHSSPDGTGAAVDSAGPARVSYSYP